jgi:hypothetical protein
MEGYGRGLISGSAPVFAWKDWEKHETTQLVSRSPDPDLNPDLPNTK